MITITFVRHGESTDNLKAVWAGWKDAPLSNHGLNQAKALGKYFSTFPITAIFASPLKRALTTAQQIQKQQLQDPLPPLTITPLIREQHFGEAEGHGWASPITTPPDPSDPSKASNATGRLGIVDPKTNKKFYPQQMGRMVKFPAGESLNDVSRRTGEAFDTFVMPFVRSSVGKKAGEVNVVFVSHGIAITETVGAILARSINARGSKNETWKGHKNTAWTRLVVGMDGESLDYSVSDATVDGDPHVMADIVLESTEDLGETDPGETIVEKQEAGDPPAGETPVSSKPVREILVKVVAVNQHPHLASVIRQKGGIGSMAHDENQKAITDFFSGGGGQASDALSNGMEVDEAKGSSL